MPNEVIEDNPAMTFVNPEVMEWLREGVGVTREAAATHTGISVETLTAWETGGEHPTRDELIRLAELYRCNWAAFLLAEPSNDHPERYAYFDGGSDLSLQVILDSPTCVRVTIETGLGALSFEVAPEPFFAEMRELEEIQKRLWTPTHGRV